MSELGFVYFLGRTAEKKVVRVCAALIRIGIVRSVLVPVSHLKRMQDCCAISCLQTCHGAEEESASLRLEVYQIDRSEVVKDL